MYTDKFTHRFDKNDMFIKDNLLMECIMGSQAYGTELATSDYDMVGIVMNPHQHLYPQQYGYVLGFNQIPTFKNKDLKGPKNRIVLDNGKDCEAEWHSLTDFFNLAGIKGSPNLIETLFVKRNLITHHTDTTWMLRDNRKLFLSMKTYQAIRGYAFQQLSRSKRALKRWKETGTCDNKNRLSLYEKHGLDTKMCSHPIRLLDLLDQLIKTGELDLQRPKEECKSMRAGNWGTFEDLETYVNAKLQSLDTWVDNNTPAIPLKPQADPLKLLLQNCIEEYYGSDSGAQRAQEEYMSVSEVRTYFNKIEQKIDKLNA